MQTGKVIALARERGVIHGADVEDIGVSRTLLPHLVVKGVLRRISRGAYVLAAYQSEHETFLAVAVTVPHGVICLLSALEFHEITTQMPTSTWIAVRRGTRIPTRKDVKLQVLRLSAPAFSEGIEEHVTDGVSIRVYSPAKTVVDCFKFRHRIGLDVAREALRDAVAQKKATRDEIWQMAKACRMLGVMAHLPFHGGELRATG